MRVPSIDEKGYGGLTNQQAVERLLKFGKNELAQRNGLPVLHLLISQFLSPLIYVLLVAAVVTLFLGDYVDAMVILLAVVINTGLGFYQEYKAQKSLVVLSQFLSPVALVVRDGQRKEIAACELVPGDMVALKAGDHVPADGVVLSHKFLSVDESILTGESRAVSKRMVRGLVEEKDLRDVFVSVGERNGRGGESIYMGTTVLSGVGEMLVVRTGMETEMGVISKELVSTRQESTPLQRRLSRLSSFLALLVGIVATILFFIGLFFGMPFTEVFTISVAVAVSAIPEGLVVSLTVILAIGMQRILQKKALVRKLLAAEVLGSVSVICSDKTGTLTLGVMQVTDVVSDDKARLIEAAVLGNLLHDPLEVGMLTWAKQEIRNGGLKNKNVRSVEALREKHLIIDHLPFHPQKRYTATLTDLGLFVVGAPETVLAASLLTQEKKNWWHAKILAAARQGSRLVGFGYRSMQADRRISHEEATKGLLWLGFLVYKDPIREGLESVLQKVYRAGIAVKVITGDYPETARAVLRQLGIHLDDSQILTGHELSHLSSLELRRRVGEIILFARTTPDQKLKIVKALQERGEVVAVTGDGVNDALALKKADIGVVVSTASDVSKEAADMVLLDNHFSTIVAAIEEGRGIFENLRKVILYLLSDSFAAIFLIVGALIFGLPLPITAAQILWINLITDGLPNLALTTEPRAPDLLKNKPRRTDEPLVNLQIALLIGLISLVTAVVVLVVFLEYLSSHDVLFAQTMAFTVLGVSTLFYVFSTRSLQTPIWRVGLLTNPWLVWGVGLGFFVQLAALYVPFLQKILKTQPLAGSDWGVVILASLVVMLVIEGAKMLLLWRGKKF